MKELMEKPFTEPLFAFSPAHSQIVASRNFAEKILSFSPDHFQAQFAEKTIGLLDNNEITSEKAIKLALTAFDYCVGDEIRAKSGRLPSWTDAAAPYYRFYAYDASYPKEVLDRLSSYLGFLPQDLIVGIPDQVFHPNFPQGIRGMLTPELAYWISNPDSPEKKPQPPCGIPRQELFRSFLKCGINPFASVKPANADAKKTDIPESTYKRLYRKKGIIYINSSSEDVNRWLKQTENHWREILDRENTKSSSDIYLFNSGTAANETVIHALSKQTDGSVYKHPFWYFENDKSVTEFFSGRLTPNPQDAQIAFVNLEPTNYFSFDNSDENFPPEQVIESITKRARDQRLKQFYLVIDVTVNPLLSVQNSIGNSIPENVTLIKTASITKHQNGGKNYFYGGVLVMNGPNLKEVIEETRREQGGLLFDQQSVFFPRLSQKQLHDTRNTVLALNACMTNVNSDINGWLIKPYTFHSLLLPPHDFAQTMINYCRKLSIEDRERKMVFANNNVKELILKIVTDLDLPRF